MFYALRFKRHAKTPKGFIFLEMKPFGVIKIPNKFYEQPACPQSQLISVMS